MRGISWLAANQLASQEGLCTVEWVSNSWCFLRVSKKSFYLQEDGCMYSYGIYTHHYKQYNTLLHHCIYNCLPKDEPSTSRHVENTKIKKLLVKKCEFFGSYCIFSCQKCITNISRFSAITYSRIIYPSTIHTAWFIGDVEECSKNKIRL